MGRVRLQNQSVPSTPPTGYTDVFVNSSNKRTGQIDDTGSVTYFEPGTAITSLTGDVTGTGPGSTATTIANDAVTYAKMQNVSATDKILGRSTAGSGDVEEIACTSAGRALIDDADASAQRTTLGLGTMATQSASSVAITGGAITGITDLVVADGGTGVSANTAYAVLCGGTTSTGPIQSIAGVGTSGQVLTSNGAGALPTFQTASGGGNSFTTIDCPAGTDPVADSATDTLTLTSTKTHITITGDSTADSVDYAINTNFLQSNFALLNGKLVASAASNALTIEIKTLADGTPSSTDPVYVAIRDATITTASYTVITLTASTTFIVSSGSTLGTTSSNSFKIWIVGFNDGGTFRLGVINCYNGTDIISLNESNVASSTAEGGAGAADSAFTFYTGTAVTSKAFKVLGYAEYSGGLATAGTWASAPTTLQQVTPATALPGTTVQTVIMAENTRITGTTAIPLDNTIPQNTEGVLLLTKAITPRMASSLLRPQANIPFHCNGIGEVVAFAMFTGASANAIVSSWQGIISSVVQNMFFTKDILANSTSSISFTVRGGPSSASNTVAINGTVTTDYFGGTLYSNLIISEIAT